MSGRRPLQFTARIYQVGSNRCLDVPVSISRALGGQRYLPVVLTLGRARRRTTLVPRGGGRHRVFLDSRVRRAAGVDTTDQVTVTLEADPQPVAPALPADLEAELNRRPGRLAGFQRLSAYLRREAVSWLEKAQRPETRAKRIARILELAEKND